MINEIAINDIPGRRSKFNNSVQNDVLHFHKSGWAACEVNTAHYKNYASAYRVYRKAVANLKVGVRSCSGRGGCSS